MKEIKDSCPVCYECEDLKYMSCSHYLCVGCYKGLHNKECPLCRFIINKKIFLTKPTHIPTHKYDKIKETLSSFLERRNLLKLNIRNKKLYRRFLFPMLKFGNCFYFRGVYYPLNSEAILEDSNSLDFHEDSNYLALGIDIEKMLEFYKFLLTECNKNHLPLVVKNKLIENIEDTFELFSY